MLRVLNANKKKLGSQYCWPSFLVKSVMWFLPQRATSFMPVCLLYRKRSSTAWSRQWANSETCGTSVGTGDFGSVYKLVGPQTYCRGGCHTDRRKSVAIITRSKTLPQRSPHSIPLVKESFLVWNMHKDVVLLILHLALLQTRTGWSHPRVPNKAGRETCPVCAVNNFPRGENGAKVSYPTRGLRGPVVFNGLRKNHGMQRTRALFLPVFTTGYNRSFGRPCWRVVCSSRRGVMHFSREIHSKLQDTSVAFPSKPKVRTLVGFSLTGYLCPVFGGPMCIWQDLQCEGICVRLEANRSSMFQDPSTWKPVQAPAKACVQIHKHMCLYNVGRQNFHARWPSWIANLGQVAETLWVIFESFLEPVICSGKIESLLTSCISL